MILIPFIVFSLWLTKNKVLKDEPKFIEYTIILVTILGVWGELAIYLKEWSFPRRVNLGIYIGNHPLELYLEAMITPLFILSIWELIKRHRS